MYVITDNCVSCGTCAENCPSDAITEGADKYEINQDLCVSCGTSLLQKRPRGCGLFCFFRRFSDN